MNPEGVIRNLLFCQVVDVASAGVAALVANVLLK